MDQVNIQKGCLVNSHTNKHICLFCIDKKCQENSRMLCQECFMGKQEFHAKCDAFITFDDLKSNEIDLMYYKSSKIKPLFDWAFQPEKELNEAIDKMYDDLFTTISQKISELKKETKVKMAEIQQKLKEDLKEYLTKQNDLSNLKDLQEEIRKFNEKLINTDKLNEILTNKQQQHFSSEEEDKYVQIYKESLRNHNIKEIDPEMFEKLEEAVLKSLNQYQLYPESEQLVIDNPQHRNIQDQQLVIANQQHRKIQNLTLIPKCNGQFRKENNNKYIKTSAVNTYLNFMSESFKRGERVGFKFRITNFTGHQYSKQVYVGITTLDDIQQNERYYFWFNKGNQIGFPKENHYKRQFNKKGQKGISEVASEGQVYILQVCVQENLIVLKDEKEECIMENSYNFQGEQEQDWVIVIGDNSAQQQNFTIEVL